MLNEHRRTILCPIAFCSLVKEVVLLKTLIAPVCSAMWFPF